MFKGLISWVRKSIYPSHFVNVVGYLTLITVPFLRSHSSFALHRVSSEHKILISFWISQIKHRMLCKVRIFFLSVTIISCLWAENRITSNIWNVRGRQPGSSSIFCNRVKTKVSLKKNLRVWTFRFQSNFTVPELIILFICFCDLQNFKQHWDVLCVII